MEKEPESLSELLMEAVDEVNDFMEGKPNFGPPLLKSLIEKSSRKKSLGYERALECQWIDSLKL